MRHYEMTPEEAAAIDRDMAASQDAEMQLEKWLSSLRELGRPVRVGLVGCGKSKAILRSRTRHLYASTLFRRCLELAERDCDFVHVLSAKHFVMDLEDEYDPYDAKMPTNADARARMGWMFWNGLRTRYPGIDLELIVYAGSAYANPLSEHVHRNSKSWRVIEPLRGMMIGQRLSFLKKELQL